MAKKDAEAKQDPRRDLICSRCFEAIAGNLQGVVGQRTGCEDEKGNRQRADGSTLSGRHGLQQRQQTEPEAEDGVCLGGKQKCINC